MFLYKLASIFFFIILSSISLYAQQDYGKTTLYLVRHAEKDTGNNPVLTSGGRERAGDLMRFLKDKQITSVYSTPYKRTRMTADSLRIYYGLDLKEYPVKPTAEELFTLLKKNQDLGKSVLLIGHSNTIPLLLKNFGVNDFPQADLADEAFDDIFIIRFKKGKALLKHKKYGKPSGASAGMQGLQ